MVERILSLRRLREQPLVDVLIRIRWIKHLRVENLRPLVAKDVTGDIVVADQDLRGNCQSCPKTLGEHPLASGWSASEIPELAEERRRDLALHDVDRASGGIHFVVIEQARSFVEDGSVQAAQALVNKDMPKTAFEIIEQFMNENYVKVHDARV